MTTANKVLGQLKPSAATPTVLYTVPALTQANANIFAANQSAASDAIRIAVTKSGNSLTSSNYVAYDMVIAANYTLNFTGFALAAGDFITIYSTSGSTSFNATGIEIS